MTFAMPFSAAFLRVLPWINLPAVVLVMLLQRTPLLRLLTGGAHQVLQSRGGEVLKAVFTLAGLGAIHGRAGATTFRVTPSNPLNGTVGTPLQLTFTYTGTPSAPQFYNVQGTLPPGLSFIPALSGGVVRSGTPVISGTPTAAGSFAVRVQGVGVGGQGQFETINFTISGGVTTVAPTITAQPQATTVTAGGSATFNVTATGTPAPSYQWRKDGTALSGATANRLTLNNVQAGDAGAYSVVVTNSAGSVTSGAATLTVTPATPTFAPAIVAQPISVNVVAGSSAALTVVATGTPAPDYQWRRNDVPITGATRETLLIGSVAAGNEGTYTVTVSNAAGFVNSSAATLSVGAGASRLANLSVRTNLAASQLLIVGFATNGAKDVLLRGIGPTLAAFGVGGVLADPRLAVFSGATQEVANDNWPASLAGVFSSLGAFALTDGSLDAALRLNVAGSRTAQVSGPAGSGGVVLVEVYDAVASTQPRLVNVSARSQVGTGDNILIAGFVVDGSVAKTLLIRAVGPTLAGFGVGGALTDPKLEIFQGQTKKVENDNWSTVAEATAAAVGAFALGAGSRDAALLVTLPPGQYSAQVSGVAGGTGEALVEVYEVP
jgi:hypothetical protein